MCPQAGVYTGIDADADIAAHAAIAAVHHAKTTKASEITSEAFDDDRIPAGIARDAEVTGAVGDHAALTDTHGVTTAIADTDDIDTHAAIAAAHHAKTTKASEITSERFPVDRLPALTDEKIWKGTGANVEEVDISSFPDLTTAIDSNWAAGATTAGEHELFAVTGKGWVKATLTGDGNDGTNTMRIYVDGALAFEKVSTTPFVVDLMFFHSFSVKYYAPSAGYNYSGGSVLGNYGV